MNKHWYFVENGNKIGPFSETELKGKINKETLVWCEGMSEWTKASYVKELESIFIATPPPIPDKEGYVEEKPKHYQRIMDSVLFGWVLIGLTIAAGFIEHFGWERNRVYSLVIGGCLLATIRVYRGLKSYFEEMLNFPNASKNINWLIGLSVPLYFLSGIEAKGYLDKEPSEMFLYITFPIILFAIISYIYHNFSLAIKLIRLNERTLKPFQTYAILQVIYFGLTIGTFMLLGEEEDDLYPLGTILEVIPIIFLTIGLKKVREKYIPKMA